MAFCSKCGKEVRDDAEICIHCGCRIKSEPIISSSDSKNAVRFCLTFLLGFIGSFIINHTDLKPVGWKSRTCAYFFLGIITFGIYSLVASICNFTFNAGKKSESCHNDAVAFFIFKSSICRAKTLRLLIFDQQKFFNAGFYERFEYPSIYFGRIKKF